jgi:hypothetical protein
MVGVGGSSPLGRTKFTKIPLSSGIFAFCFQLISLSKTNRSGQVKVSPGFMNIPTRPHILYALNRFLW